MEARDRYFTISDLPEELRPRELLVNRGAEYLTDIQLIQILLGSGTKGKGVHLLAEEVLRVIDGVGGELQPAVLTVIPGLGTAKAAVICAALEFSRRRLCPSRRKIQSPADILPAVTHFADRKQEHFLSVSLNGAHEVIGVHVVSVGLVNRTLVHPREVFAEPLVERAAAVIAAHNHPSGNVEPSGEDREITDRLKKSGDVLGIQLLDHVIFSSRGYYSFLENGQL
jgi:DNA repair protein RadC